MIIKTLLKLLVKLLLISIALVLIVLAIFGLAALIRENKTSTAIAPSTGRFIVVNGENIFIQEAGIPTNPPVLLVHGTGAWSEIWRSTMESISAAGFYVVAVDLPPFGYSDKPIGALAYSRQKQAARLEGVINSLRLTNLTLVSHSIAARPAVEAAIQIPTQLKKLVLVDPALGFGSTDPSPVVKAIMATPLLRESITAATATNPLLTKYLLSRITAKSSSISSNQVAMLQQPLNVQGGTRAYTDWLAYILAIKDSSQTADLDSLKKLTTPVVLIWGREDTTNPLAQGEQLMNIFPNAKLLVIDRVGHVPHLENPESFNRLLVENLTNSN